MAKSDLRDFKKGIDGAYKDFSREYGEAIETFFELKSKILMFSY